MRWWKLGVGLLAAWSFAACSSGPTDVASADIGAEVLARGAVTWGDGPDERFTWDLRTIEGFARAVSFSATSQSLVANASASPRDDGDLLWFVATGMGDGAPAMVFGGASPEVERVVLIDADGVQLALDLTPAADRGWQMAVQELPAAWAGVPPPAVDVVALNDGAEIARESLAGLD